MIDLTPAELMDDDRSHCEGWIRQDEMARNVTRAAIATDASAKAGGV